jgi:hypothetical protein
MRHGISRRMGHHYVHGRARAVHAIGTATGDGRAAAYDDLRACERLPLRARRGATTLSQCCNQRCNDATASRNRARELAEVRQRCHNVATMQRRNSVPQPSTPAAPLQARRCAPILFTVSWLVLPCPPCKRVACACGACLQRPCLLLCVSAGQHSHWPIRQGYAWHAYRPVWG